MAKKSRVWLLTKKATLRHVIGNWVEPGEIIDTQKYHKVLFEVIIREIPEHIFDPRELSYFDIFSPRIGTPIFLSDLCESDKSLLSSMIRISNQLIAAIKDGDIPTNPSGCFDLGDIAQWVRNSAVSTFPSFLARYSSSQAVEREPITGERQTVVEETPAMTLICKGREFWWSGLDSSCLEHHADNQGEVRDWFIAEGKRLGLDVSQADATAYAKAIAPDWFKNGARPREAVKVPFPHNS